MTELSDRYHRSLGRVGTRLLKNARWFLRFVEADVARFDELRFEQYWDDLVTLCQLGETEGRKRPGSRKPSREEKVTVRIGRGTTLVYDERRYRHGEVVDVPESIAVGLVQGSSAEYAGPPPVIRYERQSPEALLNAWEYAATWPARNPGEDRQSEGAARVAYRNEVLTIQQQIRRAVLEYLGGGEPIIVMRSVTFRLGAGQLLPTFPFSIVHPTPDGSWFVGPESGVLARFLQVFAAYGKLFRRCPSCQNIFVANRADQRACKGLCRSKFGMQRLRNERNRLAERRKVLS